MHRGPTHSFITITVLMIPFFVVYKKQAIPYYAALLSHILIGDFFTGGSQLLWPLTQTRFAALNYSVTTLPVQITELVLFAVTLPIMYKLKDLQSLLKPNNKNWVLIIPLAATVGPMFALGTGGESTLPSLLLAPSIFYVLLFSYSIFVWLKSKVNRQFNKENHKNNIAPNFPNSSIPNR